jgi:type I restriction enzyme S subunit
LESFGQGSTFKELSKDSLENVFLVMPPPNQQYAIANFLDRETGRIDALVEKKERLIELLKEKRTAIITHAVSKGLDPNVPMKDSGVEWLSEIPAHWEMKQLRHLGDPIIGLTYDPSDVVGPDNGGMLVLRASNVLAGHIVFEDNVFVKCAIPHHLRTKRGDILICSRSGSRALIGKSAKIDGAAVGLTFGTFMTVFRSACNDFLFWAFNSTLFDYQSGAYLTSTINQLTIGNLKSLMVPVPPQEERSAIAAFLGRETAKIDALVHKIRDAIERLKEYRTAFISAAVTGKIDVRQEVEKA